MTNFERCNGCVELQETTCNGFREITVSTIRSIAGVGVNNINGPLKGSQEAHDLHEHIVTKNVESVQRAYEMMQKIGCTLTEDVVKQQIATAVIEK